MCRLLVVTRPLLWGSFHAVWCSWARTQPFCAFVLNLDKKYKNVWNCTNPSESTRLLRWLQKVKKKKMNLGLLNKKKDSLIQALHYIFFFFPKLWVFSQIIWKWYVCFKKRSKLYLRPTEFSGTISMQSKFKFSTLFQSFWWIGYIKWNIFERILIRNGHGSLEVILIKILHFLDYATNPLYFLFC